MRKTHQVAGPRPCLVAALALALGLVCVSFGAVPGGGAAPTNAIRERNRNCIKPYRENRRYWQYRQKPVLLLGGSKTDHIFLLEELAEHLDEIVAVGGNYVRNTMSQREGVELKPHLRLPSGKFDLGRWNPVYWKRFSNCLRWCEERGIIIQIEVWDRFDYSQEMWTHSPWNPWNNVTYSSEETGLARKYPQPAWRDRHPFFHTIAGMRPYRKQYDVIRQHQERFVDKMLSHSLQHANVLYCMNNETSTAPAWGRYWMRFIREKAKDRGVEVYLTDMFDDGWKPHASAKVRQAIDDPTVYPFIDISQVNSRTFNEDHWKRFFWVVEEIQKRTPRPLNHTKIYSDGQTSWGSGTPKDGVERFWRNLIAGAASCRFHRPGGGIGLNEVAKACIRAARKVESEVRFWEIEPRMGLLTEREEDEAYLAAKPGTAYVVYFTDGGAVRLDLAGHPGSFQLRWVDVARGDWGGSATLKGGAAVPIAAPSAGGWVAVVLKE